MSILSMEEQVSQNYHDNISYFQEQHPKLLEKISSFESALEHGHYEANYELEYKDEGYFDVKELSSGAYLYGQDSHKYAKKCADGINFEKKGSLFETFYNFSFTDGDIESYKDLGIESNGASGIAPIIHYTTNAVSKETQMKRIEKFIFFGVGVGTHLAEVAHTIESKAYLIVEDDIELFRLSMFVTNYQQLSKHATLFFTVFAEDEEAKVVFGEFLEKNFFYNQYIKYFQMLNCSDEKVNMFHSVVASLDYMVYPYHAYFTQYLRPLEYMKEGYRFLDVSHDREEIFGDKPLLVVAAGPSLKKNIKWLQKHHDKFVIMTLTSTLTTLIKHDISPDIVVHLDPFEAGSMPHVESLDSLDFLDKTLFLFSAKSPKMLVEKFDKKRVFIYEESTNYIEKFGQATSSCVGSTAHALSLILGAKKSYLLGLDLALDEKSGSTHSPDHQYNKSLDISDAEQVKDLFSYRDSTMMVKGNFQDKVYTTAPFYNSIIGVHRNALVYQKEGQEVYNLNDGALLHGTKPLQIDDFKMDKFAEIDKDLLHAVLLESFKRDSIDSFDESVIAPIRLRRKHIKKVKKILKRYQKHTTYTHIDSYRRGLDLLVNALLNSQMRESLQLVVIYYKYLQYVLPYVYDMLNTRELPDSKIHMKNIDTLLIEKLVQIVDYYEEMIEGFLKEVREVEHSS